ncbi:hypothetical protein PMIT1313_00117 [Prochlorococcus marinus str. MIT 1313]|uniref:class I SAM-dependent methyltransferase n=1 Tax=Prochlorococcus TaxID=1218 RepID=UPI0007B3F82F|nr:class I SAM-dependent methyltransferase [Prochlorococcus marinus]KZR72032.1 hypothetical protein PMIT1313_00117 [Prochlorococcus marinus str. MIT 1313]KZR74592.1 hypothetical protein PMIT1318_00335 [Prochlorococcus marinus str. MIT 1318]
MSNILKTLHILDEEGKELTVSEYLNMSIIAAEVAYKDAIKGDDPGTVLKILLALRRTVIEKKVYLESRGEIIGGVFRGMKYLPTSRNSVLMPKLIGTYESEVSELLIRRGKTLNYFIDVGCAEGYYVAGLAYRFPKIDCIGVDIEPESRALAATLCDINGLKGNTSIFENIDGATKDLAGNVLALIDVDGDEINMINKVINLTKGNKNISALELVIETDRNDCGTSTEEEIKNYLQLRGFTIQQIIRQDIHNRVSSVTESWDYYDRMICGHERSYSEQSWIVTSNSSTYHQY